VGAHGATGRRLDGSLTEIDVAQFEPAQEPQLQLAGAAPCGGGIDLGDPVKELDAGADLR
jgi:hypothetical protein